MRTTKTATLSRSAGLCALICCAVLGLGAAQASAEVPTVVNKAADPVTDASATFNGTVATDSALSDCHFEYVDPVAVKGATNFADLSSGGSVPCDQSLGSIAADSSPHPVSVVIPLPAPGAPYYHRRAPYYYRLVAANADGAKAGSNWRGVGFGVPTYDGTVLDESGNPATQAGSRPFSVTTDFSMTTTVGDAGVLNSTDDLKDAIARLPAGLVANPKAGGIAQCTETQLAVARPQCPSESQVGVVTIKFSVLIGLFQFTIKKGIYNMVPPPGTPAAFGFNYYGNVTHLRAGLRTGEDYGATVVTENAPENFNLHRLNFEFWGVPADSAHDGARYFSGTEEKGAPGGALLSPFITSPTSCVGPTETLLTITGWYGGEASSSFLSHDNTLPTPNPVGNDGCNALQFEPTIEARPTTNVADSASGLDVDLQIPQDNGECEAGPPVECGTATAHLKDTTVTLPEGLVINPSGANGLDGCSLSEFGYTDTGEDGTIHTTPDPATCPDASKQGTVEVETELLDEPLKGGVYLADPHDNPFDSLFALYLAVDDEKTGIVVKLAGEVETDPNTGRITASFKQNPQLPFEHFKLHFFGGAGGALRTPATCGTYTTTSSMTPWSSPDSGPPATPSDAWAIQTAPGGGNCPTSQGALPNSPDLDAGSVSPVAAASTPTVVNLSRNDGTQEFSAINLKLPPGMTGKLVGISQCSGAALASAAAKSGRQEKASPSCPANSRIGVVDVAAGAGPAPYNTQGTAYLTGPYKGAPLGIAIVTPATAGPFDLGTVVVRIALHVDRNSGQITAVSDPIPSILQGVPLDVRSAKVTIDRPDFTRNGTSCEPSSFEGNLVSTLNQSASLTERFQLGECSALSFKPKLAIRLSGGTKRGGHPALRGVLQMPLGGANIAKTSVALPKSEFLDQSHIGTVCTRVQFAAKQCPAASVYGYATATSPLVDYTVEGPVYLRSSNNKLPDLVIALHGPSYLPIEVDAVGRVDSIKGGIRTTFEGVPDIPFTRLVLTMAGGKKGLLENSRDICAKTYKVTAKFEGHNGKVADLAPPLKNSSCGKSKKGKRHQAPKQPKAPENPYGPENPYAG